MSRAVAGNAGGQQRIYRTGYDQRPDRQWNYTSKNFDTPPNGWKFNYDYSCKWDGISSGISISVGDAQNPNADPGPIVFEDSVKKKSGTSDALNGGSWYFKVETFGNTCSWHVSVPKS